MSTAARRQRRKVGNLLAIPMANDSFCFGRERAHSIVAFYDLRSKSLVPPEELLMMPVVFSVAVMDYAITSARWPIIAWAPLEPELRIQLKFFIQDKLNGQFRIYLENGTIVPAERREIEGLECAAAWDPEHVEERLRDHFAGVKNTWVESLKPK